MVAADQARTYVKSNVVGASFWLRLAAFVFDYVVVALPISYATGFAIAYADPSLYISLGPSSWIWQAVTVALMVAYYACFEASPLQATPGKFVFGLVVVSDPDMRRVPLHRAAGRFLVLCFPFVPLISACTVAFGKDKRGIHDGAASCIVISHSKLANPTNVDGDTKQCPMCAERVQVAAKICHYCQYRFDGSDSGGRWALRILVFVVGVVSVVVVGNALDNSQPQRQAMTYSLSTDNRQNRYLHFKGDFVAGDSQRLITAVQSNSPQFVTLDSPGGSVSDAMAVGRAIRSAGIATFIEPGASCESACFLAFIGGVRRYASAKARLGVHQSSFPTNISFGTAASHIESLKHYMLEMGIDPEVLDISLRTPADKMHYFTAREAENLNVASIVASED
jgi:uncharacterized RDD family membrane protein YckC